MAEAPTNGGRGKLPDEAGPGQEVGPEVGQGAAAAAEAIASKDLNNLYLTSCYFEDRAKYRAFCALYAVMRVVDDRIDAIPSRAELTEEDRQREKAVAAAWRRGVEAGYEDREPTAEDLALCDHPQAALLLEGLRRTVTRFPVPSSLWQNFFDAMERDVDRPRFATYEEFLDYAEGATVAPTTIYLFLIAARPSEDAVYGLPEAFDLIACGRHLGLFAYLGHILRDLAQDYSASEEGLLYLAEDDMDRFGLTEEQLGRDVTARRCSPPLRSLVEELVGRSRRELAEGRRLAEALEGKLTPDCAFVLELICAIYEHILDKIEDKSFDPLVKNPRLSLLEKTRIALDTARKVGFEGDLEMPPLSRM